MLRSCAAIVALAFAIVAPCLANAADVPVSYTVEDKPFKTAVAGTVLTFELHDNAACTSLVDSQAIPVETVTLILKLKQHTPKDDVKLPSTMELRTTLLGATSASPLYLQVTGTGVVPVGGACQAQAAGGQGSQALLPRTVFVPADGSPAANGAALIAAAAGITGDIDRPTTLQLDDGTYDIGTTTLALDGIVLAGRSAEHTFLIAGGSATLSDTAGGAVRTNSNVHDLTISIDGAGAANGAGIVFVGFGTITRTHVNVSNVTNAYGIWNVFGTLTATHVRVSVASTFVSVGVRNDTIGLGALTRVQDSKVSANSDNASEGFAVLSDGGAVRATNCIFSGSQDYARANGGSLSFRLRNCGLAGTFSSAVQCVNSSTALNSYPNTCPSETWSTLND